MSGQKISRICRGVKEWFLQLSKKKKIGVCVGGILVCFLIIGISVLAVKFGKINSEDINADDLLISDEAGLSAEGYTNIALFGIDSRTGELEKGTRTDCLIVASLNNKTKEVKMVSVYRDTVLDIEEDYLQKCNAAYAFGGPTQAINMLNKNLDLNIQEYATVDFAAIANAIDMLGGLEIDVKQEEIKPLNKFVKETARVAGKKAHTVSEPGLQLLDGVQATTYARIRSTAGGDFTRTERQRLVIEKIIEKAQKTDIATINKMIDELFPTIKTSFSVTEILAYAKDFMKYDIVGSEGFPFDKTTATVSGLGSIVIPVTLADNVIRLHEFLYGEENYVPSATVQSINDAIIARVGERDATDYSTLSTQTYVDTEEDKAQEHNEYQPKPETKHEEEPESEVKSEKEPEPESEVKPEKEPEKDTTVKPESKPESDNTEPESEKDSTEGDKNKPVDKEEKPSGDNSAEDKADSDKPAADDNVVKPEEEKPVETPPKEDEGSTTPPDVEGNEGEDSTPEAGSGDQSPEDLSGVDSEKSEGGNAEAESLEAEK